MVGSQIPNLTFGPSFDHKLCISSLNEQCKDTLSSYILKPFQWYLGGPNWCLFSLSTKALNIWDFPTNATPQVRMHFGNHWVHSLTLSPTCENVFYSQTYFLGLMCFCTRHLFMNPMLRLQHTRFFGLNFY